MPHGSLTLLTFSKASSDLCLGQALRALVTGPSCADAAMSLAVLLWRLSTEKAAEEEESPFSLQFMVLVLTVFGAEVK